MKKQKELKLQCKDCGKEPLPPAGNCPEKIIQTFALDGETVVAGQRVIARA